MKKLSINDFENFAIIQTAFIGDVILTFPLVQLIKELNPNSKITFITTPISSELANIVEAIDKVIVYDKRNTQKGIKGIINFSKLLNEYNFDCIISPHRSLRTTLLTFLTQKKISIGFNTSVCSFLYKKRAKYKFHYHEIERNCFLLSHFKEFDKLTETFYVKLKSESFNESIINTFLNEKNIAKPYITIAPGSIWGTKRWLKEYYAELAKLFMEDGRNVILIGSAQDYEICKFIQDQTEATNLAGKTTLVQVLYILSKSDLLVTNDSSPTHLAGLVRCPTAVIWGPTSPIFGFGPRGENDISIELEDLKCRPCHIHGKQECPIKTHQCMRDLTPVYVYERCKSLLNDISNDLKDKME